MKYPDPHNGSILTAKTPELKAHFALSGTNDEIERDFHIFETEGNSLHDSLQFAESFFMTRNELFTTYEIIWLDAEDLDEFEKLYILERDRLSLQKKNASDCFQKIFKFIQIAKKNHQDIIFFT